MAFRLSPASAAAGAAAARYLRGELAAEAGAIPVTARGGVRYTVPSAIHPSRMADEQLIRFRVGDVYRSCCTAV